MGTSRNTEKDQSGLIPETVSSIQSRLARKGCQREGMQSKSPPYEGGTWEMTIRKGGRGK